MSDPPPPPPDETEPSTGWPEASALLCSLMEETPSQRHQGFHHVFRTLRPWIDDSLHTLCQRQYLLADSASICFTIVHRLLEAGEYTLANGARSESTFGILLQSMALRAMKDEIASHKAGLLPSEWDSFRFRLNARNREERGFILAALPPITRAQDAAATLEIPTPEWLALWEEVIDGIPATALPLEWQRYLESPPSTIHEKACDAPTIWIPSRSNEFEQRLGREFFKAAIWTAKQCESTIILNPPSWVGTPSPTDTSHSISSLLEWNGDGLQDAVLHAHASALLANPHEAMERPSALDLFKTSADLGFSRFLIEMMRATCLRETGDGAGAVLALRRATNHCQSKGNLSNVLATSAAFHILDHDIDGANALLQEALRLAPWSGVARSNLQIVRSILEHGPNLQSRGTNGQ